MSKKSVSDILKSIVVFPNSESAYISSRFEVRNHPVLVKAFGIDCDTIGALEMGYNDGCGGWTWAPYVPDCDQLAILGCANALAIGMPGWYRIVFRDRITGEPISGSDDLLVTVTETDMPASMLAQFTGGSASMGCGSQVTIREEDGCFYISVDNQAYAICPGSTVTCDPNGLGIVIDGELCVFPEQQEVSAVINEDGCLVITIDNVTTTICNSITIVSNIGDGIFQATNPDGSVVTWNGENSVTLVDEFEDGQFRATNPDGSTVDWNGNDSITTVSNLGNGQFQAENPDGSLVTWDGENSVTTADVDTTDNTITITNPDGSTVTFYYLQEEPQAPTPQTQVSNGTGSQANQNTYTVDHKGTWPNETIRTMWGERSGDIVELNFWNPTLNGGSWDSVAIEAPENIVILNNPVIYIRPTGSANPPIETQADLTVANAFDSFASVRTFMRRTLTVGRVTLDVRGTYNGGIGLFGPAQFKNAQEVLIRGNPDSVTDFVVQVGFEGTGTASQQTGGEITFQDVTFNYVNQATSPGRATPVQALAGATVVLAGKIRYQGTYITSRAGSAPGYLGYAVAGNIEVASGTELIFAFTNNTELNAGFNPQAQSQLTLGANVIISPSTTASFGSALIDLASGSSMRSVVTGGNPPQINPGNQPKADHSIRVNPLASLTVASYPSPVREYDFGVDLPGGTTPAQIFVSTAGTLNNSLGSDT